MHSLEFHMHVDIGRPQNQHCNNINKRTSTNTQILANHAASNVKSICCKMGSEGLLIQRLDECYPIQLYQPPETTPPLQDSPN